MEHDPARTRHLLNTLLQLKTKIDSNIVPDRLSEYPDNWQCKYCQFKIICQMAGAGELGWEIFKNKIEVEGNQDSAPDGAIVSNGDANGS